MSLAPHRFVDSSTLGTKYESNTNFWALKKLTLQRKGIGQMCYTFFGITKTGITGTLLKKASKWIAVFSINIQLRNSSNPLRLEKKIGDTTWGLEVLLGNSDVAALIFSCPSKFHLQIRSYSNFCAKALRILSEIKINFCRYST